MCSQQDWHKRLHTPDQFPPPPKKKCKGRKKSPEIKKSRRKQQGCAVQEYKQQSTNSSFNSCDGGKRGERISTGSKSVTAGGGRCEAQNEGGGRTQGVRGENEHGRQLGRKSEEGFCGCSSACGGVGY